MYSQDAKIDLKSAKMYQKTPLLRLKVPKSASNVSKSVQNVFKIAQKVPDSGYVVHNPPSDPASTAGVLYNGVNPDIEESLVSRTFLCTFSVQ